MSQPFNGKCPVCQADLVQDGGDACCQAEADPHFRIRVNVFDAAWLKYDKGVLSEEALLKLLLQANISSNRPNQNPVRA